jgi:hypothetical protein
MARPVRIAIADAESNPSLAGGPDFIGFDLSSGVPADRIANVDAAAEGAFVIIADDHLANAPPGTAGRMNGRIYRLGARRADMDNASIFSNTGITASRVFELQPGNDFNRDPGANGAIYNSVVNPSDNDDVVAIGNRTPVGGSNSTVSGAAPQYTADAYLIGRGFSSETLQQIAAGGPAMITYDGGNMAISAFSAFVQVNK